MIEATNSLEIRTETENFGTQTDVPPPSQKPQTIHFEQAGPSTPAKEIVNADPARMAWKRQTNTTMKKGH